MRSVYLSGVCAFRPQHKRSVHTVKHNTNTPQSGGPRRAGPGVRPMRRGPPRRPDSDSPDARKKAASKAHEFPGAARRCAHLEHLECSLQPSPPGCFTKKLSEARGNGIGFVTAG